MKSPEKSNPQLAANQEVLRENLSEVHGGGIEQLRVIKTQYGNVSLASDIGIGHHENEDRIFIDTSKNLFGVVDGMGGYAHGAEAAQIVAEEVLRGVKANIHPDVLQWEASTRMRKEQIFMGGACYTYFQVEKKSAVIRWAGDAALIVINEKGDIVYETKGSSLEQAPRGNSPGKVSSDVAELMNYSTVIAASDGLWDNINKDDIQRIVKEAATGQTDQMARKLFDMAKYAMEHGFMTNYGGLTADKRKDFGKKDNVSIVIFQKLPNQQ
jgi:serine/threonine protein phosphatase PrpC